MSDYSGPERRKMEMDYEGPPKRKEEKCLLCDVLWKNHDDEKKLARDHICKAIATVAKDVKDNKEDQKEIRRSSTPRWFFALTISASFLFSIFLFGWISTAVKDGQKEVKDSLASIHQRITINDREEEAANKGFSDALRDLNYSVQSIDSRLRTVEKYVETKAK